LVFLDVWGLASVESSCEFLYFLTCVNAFNIFTWIFPIQRKSYVMFKFQYFKSMAEKQLGFTLKYVQSNWGGEFKPLNNLLYNRE
jgi:hypothetical protein